MDQDVLEWPELVIWKCYLVLNLASKYVLRVKDFLILMKSKSISALQKCRGFTIKHSFLRKFVYRYLVSSWKGSFKNLVDIILHFNDHSPTSVDIIYVLNVDKNGLFLTTYLPLLVHVVIEWHLKCSYISSSDLLHKCSQIRCKESFWKGK